MIKKEIFLKKKLNYGYEITSYLMRERIVSANLQFDTDEMMDMFAEYLSQCKIPWKYAEESGICEIGYILSIKNMATENNGLPTIRITFTEEHKSEISIDINIKLEGEFTEDFSEEYIDLDTVPLHLQNQEIRKMFLYAFNVAEKEIDIISPWMNRAVVNEDFLNRMSKAMERGVCIKIIYGLEPDSNEYNMMRSRRSDQVADLLRRRFADKGNQLQIRRDNIHYKLVLCDEKYKLEGGYNYLSFVGNYSEVDLRREGSPFGRDNQEIKHLRKLYFEG